MSSTCDALCADSDGMTGVHAGEVEKCNATGTAAGGSGWAVQPIATHSATGQCASMQQIFTDDAITAALCSKKIEAMSRRRK